MKRLFSRFFIFALLASFVGGGFSGSQAVAAYHPGGDDYEAGEEAAFLPAIVRVESENVLDEMVASGDILLRRRGDLALMFLRNDGNDRNHQQRRIIRRGEDADQETPRIEIGRRVSPSMDMARASFGAERILTGESLPKSFTGKGVVTGICDIGFDPSHSNFKDANGDTRIRRIVQYKEAEGARIVMESEEEYTQWTTDTTDHFHATHVAGIMAGSDNSIGYGGVASGADIVITTSQLSDVGLLAGVEDIIEYARSVGKPAVVNLSMGSYVGPHDGTSLFSQYMDMLGEEAIICLSAGNEGATHHTNSLTHIFTPEQNRIGQRIHNYRWNQFDIAGMTDIWSGDRRTLRLQPLVYDETTRSIVLTMPELQLSNGNSWKISTADETPEAQEFTSYFTGWFEAKGEVNPDNGRYNVILTYDLHTEEKSSAGEWARYNIGFLLEGEPGQRIDIFADGVTSRLREIPGSPAPGCTFSVSDLATGQNVICVGMYNSRSQWPTLSGIPGDGKVEAQTVNVNSSYGTLLDGRTLPHTVAPGNPIISSFSGPYLDAHPEDIPQCAGFSSEGTKKHYWGMEGGTSMSSPYVAGFIATFLEADPTLDVQDIKRLIAATNHTDVADPTNPRHGNGWFDPYAIMQKILENTSVPGTLTPRIKAEVAGGGLHITNPDSESLTITIHDTTGRLLSRLTDSSPDQHHSLSPFTGQLLLITIHSPNSVLHVRTWRAMSAFL